jgi:hypothetical protein
VRISTRPHASFVSHIVSVICAKPSRQISKKPATSRTRVSRWEQGTAFLPNIARMELGVACPVQVFVAQLFNSPQRQSSNCIKSLRE